MSDQHSHAGLHAGRYGGAGIDPNQPTHRSEATIRCNMLWGAPCPALADMSAVVPAVPEFT